MATRDYRRSAFAVALATAILAGCGGAQTSAVPQGAAQSRVHQASGSYGDLLYAATYSARYDHAYIAAYPSEKYIAQLTSVTNPRGLCVDKAQDVWVVNDVPNEVLEYAHGASTPLATLSDPGIQPIGCAVNPLTGDLAVANYGYLNGKGTIDIYRAAKGNPTTYNVSAHAVFCAYDDSGDLFVSEGSRSLLELPKGHSKFRQFPVHGLSGDVNQLVSLQWKGGYLIVSSPDPRTAYDIYRIKIAGKFGRVEQITILNCVVGDVTPGWVQFWVQGSRIIGSSFIKAYLRVWHYPRGGNYSSLRSHSGLHSDAEVISLGKT